jgi:hypothetical protein
MKRLLHSAIAAAALAVSAPAYANIVSYNGTDYSPGSTIDISFTGQSDGNPVAGLSADLSLTFLSVNGSGDYLFSWILTNTSTLHPLSEVTAFGFNTDPNITGATVTGSFTNTSSGSISNGFFVEFCATGGPNCAGGASNGDGVGGGSFAGNLTLLFAGTADPGTITISQPIVRFQSTGNGQGSAIGVPTAVPEPATWAMLLIGFGATGYALRRRRKPAIAQLA